MMRARITLEDIEAPEVLEKSISPEAATDMPRTNISVQRSGDSVVIDIEAEDASSLRAALNSYLRWTDLAMKTHELAGDKE